MRQRVRQALHSTGRAGIGETGLRFVVSFFRDRGLEGLSVPRSVPLLLTAGGRIGDRRIKISEFKTADVQKRNSDAELMAEEGLKAGALSRGVNVEADEGEAEELVEQELKGLAGRNLIDKKRQ